jgi:hypothetical protein
MDRSSLARILTLSLAFAALLLVATGLYETALWVRGPLFVVDGRFFRFIIWSVTNAAHALFAAYIAWKVPRYGVVLGAMYFAGGAFARAAVNDGSLLISALQALALGACGGGAIRFSQLFPREVRADDLPLRSSSGALRPHSAVARVLLIPAVVWGLVFGADITHFVFRPAWMGWGNMLRNLFVAASALGFMRINYLRSSPGERQKIYWILQGILLILLSVVGNLGFRAFELPVPASILFALGQLALVTCVAFAVFYNGAVDSGLVLQRTAWVSLTSGVMVVLFITLETVTGEVLVGALGLGGGAAPIIAGIVTALTFHVVQDAVKSVVHKLVPRSD